MEGETTAVEVVQKQGANLSLKQITDRVNLVHTVLDKVMKKGTHFGTVPGCGAKMVLLKPGADVLAMTFRLAPQFQVTRTDLENGHREYDVTCSMYGGEGTLLGQGVGSCSTMEKKYRYRKDDRGNKIENEDIADVYNTVLKMAKKRAHVDATLTVTGAGDLFTQDLIDEDEPTKPPISMPVERQNKASGTSQASSPAQVTHLSPDALTGIVDAVSKKATKKGGTRYGVNIGGEWYGTFDDKLGAMAEYLKGAEVRYTWTQDGTFKNLATLAAVEPPVQQPKTTDSADDNVPF